MTPMQIFFIIFDPRVPLLDGTYWVMIAVLGAILLVAILTNELRLSYEPQLRVVGTEYAAAVAACLGLAGFATCVETTGADVLLGHRFSGGLTLPVR